MTPPGAEPPRTRTPWHRPNGRRHDQTNGWARQQRDAQIMAAHAGICHICRLPGADQIDHIIPIAEGGPDTPNNLAPIHAHPCHARKTAAEAARGKRRRTHRPPEPHPGLR